MEDNLHKNGRKPQILLNGRQPQKNKMEDNLKKMKMEDDLNFFFKSKTTIIFDTGR